MARGSAIGVPVALPHGDGPNSPAWTSANLLKSSDYLTEKVFDAAGNLYEASSFVGTINIGGTTLQSKGLFDAYVAKYSSTGALLWLRQLGSSTDESIDGICLDAAGNVYVAGGFTSSLAIGNGVMLNGRGFATSFLSFVIRYSSQGTPTWAQQNSNFTSANSSAQKVNVDAAGNVVVLGGFDNDLTIGNTTIETTAFATYGTYIATFSSAGVPQSLIRAYEYLLLPSPAINLIYLPTAVIAKAGAVYVVSQFVPDAVFNTNTTLHSRGGVDVLIAKYTPSGVLEWVQQFGGADDDFGLAAEVDAAGNVYMGGAFNSAISFGATTLTSKGKLDGYLTKYSPQGAPLWIRSFGNSGIDIVFEVGLDAGDNPYLTGQFQNQVILPPVSFTAVGSTDALVAAYTPQGQVRWVHSAGGAGDTGAGSMGFDAQGDILVTGYFYDSCSFGSIKLNTSGSLEHFVARLHDPTVVPTKSLKGLYPNPATDLVHLDGLLPGASLQIIDVLGRVVREITLTPAATFSVRGLAAGLYIVRATDAQGERFQSRLEVE
ncbi:hypothetical protein GCM10022409_06140 [Hymenobacter glaciei]|uniref:Secretion system C-terminal sorting domain-containing protein n=1 Tax=Hymenobacter glaciei TaxID=877209 RepID=A0ABP7TEE0_9BACT